MMNRNSLVLALVVFLVQACTNITSKSGSSLNTTNITFTAASGGSTSYTHLITSNVTIVALTSTGTSGNADYQLTLPLDTSQANYQPLTNFCGGTSDPCDCELDWNESSTSGTYNTTYQRTKKIPILSSDVQSGLAKCTVPYDVWSQIPNGTQVTMNIVPVSPNVTGLNVRSVNYKVGTSVGAQGDFFDSTLTPFRNIMRYSCYSKAQNSFQILNKYYQATPYSTPSSGDANPVNLYFASQFCSQSSSSGGTNANTSDSGSGQCAVPRNGWSAQSYYRNF